MAGVMEELLERVRRETIEEISVEFAKKLIAERDKLTLEEIAVACDLPLEKVQALAASK